MCVVSVKVLPLLFTAQEAVRSLHSLSTRTRDQSVSHADTCGSRDVSEIMRKSLQLATASNGTFCSWTEAAVVVVVVVVCKRI